MKYDLTRKAVAAFPELSRISNEEGAVRSSVVADAAIARDATALKIPSGEFVAVKAPTLDGTELWLVARDRQEEFEKSMGFEKASVPLMAFPAERLEGLSVLRDPEQDESLLIQVER